MSIAGKLTIEYLKSGYQRGDFTPEEICERIVRRAEETKEMNIWIQQPDMLKIKPYLEHLKNTDREKKALWGIPFAIKDNIDLAGERTTAGCESYAYTAKENATVVDLLIEEGAIPVGKTNLDQFATGLVGTRSLYGETHNALRGELISGGSSSGSAVSVAMGQAAFSLGTDTAGSGRVPAALNHLIGFKPTLGAWSTKGVVPACESLDCVTVFTHNVEDALTVDKIERKFDRKSPWSKKSKRVQVRIPKKVFLPNNPLTFYGPFEQEYRTAWNTVVRTVEQLDLEIEYIDDSIFFEAAAILYDGPWIAERWSSLGEFVERNQGKNMVSVTEKILLSGNRKDLKAHDVFRAIHRIQEIKGEVRNLLEDSVLLMPTAGGTYTREEVRNNPVTTNSHMGMYTNHCNLLDLCAISFQSGFAAEKLPFGVTSFALNGEDGLNFGMAKIYPSTKSGDFTELSVCGLHMRGFALEHQLTDLGAVFDREDKTAPEYQLYKLPTHPVKPGLIHVSEGGSRISLEVWKIPTEKLGFFMKMISAPLVLGKVKLESGAEVTGFLCEEYGLDTAENITKQKKFHHRANRVK